MGGTLSTTQSHHIKISLNNTLIMVEISGGGQPNYISTKQRTETKPNLLGTSVPVWFMSNKRNDDFNLGNGTFSNIEIISNVFETAEPTFTPTRSPTETTLSPTTLSPTDSPLSPTNIPTIYPTPYPTQIPSQITLNSLVSKTNEPTSNPIIYITQSDISSVLSSSANIEWPYLLIVGSAGLTLAILCIFLFYKLIKIKKLKTETFKLNNELKASNQRNKSFDVDFVENDQIFSDIACEEGIGDQEAIKDLTVPSKTSKIRQYALKPHGNQLNIIKLHYGERHRSPEFTVSNSSALYMSHHHPVKTEGNETMPNLAIDDDDDVIMNDIITSNDGELSFSAHIKSAQSFNKHKDVILKIDIPETVEEIIESQKQNVTKRGCQYSDDETSESSMTFSIKSEDDDECKTALPPPPTRKVVMEALDDEIETPVAPIVDAQKILHALQVAVEQKVGNGKIKRGISADLVDSKQTKGHWM